MKETEKFNAMGRREIPSVFSVDDHYGASGIVKEDLVSTSRPQSQPIIREDLVSTSRPQSQPIVREDLVSISRPQ